MRLARVSGILWFASMLTAGAAWAQAMIQVGLTDGKVTIQKDTPLSGLTSAGSLSIQCLEKVDCAKIEVRGRDGAAVIQSTEEVAKDKAAMAKPFRTYKLADAGSKLQVVYDGATIGTADIADGGARQPAQAPLLCTAPPNVPPTYDRRANRATFWVSHLGNIWAHPTDQIDENDEVEVVVIAPEDLLPLLRVKRVSPTRVVGGITIIGEDLFRQALEQRSRRCGVLRVVLSDFAPGAGQVQITLQSNDKELPSGAFEFSVAPLYDGYLSFAAVYSDAIARTFTLAPQGDGTIIVPGEVTGPGQRDIRYAVFYTPFVWGKREIVKGPDAWYHRVNPTFGVTTSELAEHFLYGASVDFGGFTVVGGLHSARQTILHPDSGLQPGDRFAGKATDIPTAKDWTNKGFVAVGADLRAAVALFKAALGVGKFGSQ